VTAESDPLAPARRFRHTSVRYGLAGTAVLAAAGYFISGRFAAQGVLLGGLGGVLGFWIMASRLEKLATVNPQKVHFAALTWTSFRFLLYGAVLARAYFLDREHLRGLIGAVVGLLVIRFVMIGVGITNIDRGAGQKHSASEAGPSEPRE
jgi:hypothetical protein